MTPWEKMLLLVGAVYAAFKALTIRGLPVPRAAAYALLWPGMDPRPFARLSPTTGGPGLMVWGAAKMALGAALLSVRAGWFPADAARVLIGAGLLVHFGLCDFLAGFWRGRGVPVERLFVNPAAARTLAEFWGRRWNLAFHAVARDFVFRPVARRAGRTAGVLAAFAFSGAIHEILLSAPVGAGWGLPSLYFLLQGTLVLAERRWGLRGRAWTLFWVLAPLGLLFHPAFLRGIVAPLV